MRFSGKTVVVTGAAAGIGAESARLFAREGAVVIAADIDTEGGERLARESEGDIRFRQCDVCNVEAIRSLMDFAASETGGIDTLLNNAGAGGARAPIDEIEPADWDATMDLLLRSVAMGIRYAVPHMIGRPSTRTGAPRSSRARACINNGPIATTSPTPTKAHPQEIKLVPPRPVGSAMSRIRPKITGPAKEPMNPMHECTAMVEPW